MRIAVAVAGASNEAYAIRLTKFTAALIAATAFMLVACASSHVMLGKPRDPISPDQVQIYYGPPPAKYDQIAMLNTSSSGSFSFSAQGKTDAVIQRLKGEAAKLGANGVLLQAISDQASGSIGLGGGSASASGNSAVGVGVGGGFTTHRKAGTGVAIYVYPNPTP
jgi:hypothetical protein